jgi:integrase
MFSITKGGVVMKRFHSFLAPVIREYIFYRKASDHWNNSYEMVLLLFDRYCLKEYAGASKLSQEMADGWCRKRSTEKNNSCRTRVGAVIGLIRYMRQRGKTDIAIPAIPRKQPETYIPHAFTSDELGNFFQSCDNISNRSAPEHRSRKITIPVFFRLLYSSGIRTVEARLLYVNDVDLKNGILNIRYSKGNNQHFIVLHDTTLELMREYDTAISRIYPDRTYFFPARNNKHHICKWVHQNFRKLWDEKNTSYATAYELRHHYAIENINRWTGKGLDFHAKLLYLSKSMGHCNVESTKYYYSLVPNLADILIKKTGDSFNNIIPEVKQDETIE